MVDVTGKPPTARRAVARCLLVVGESTRRDLIADASRPGGELLAEARTAGQMAGKRTADLLPLCHPLLLGDITVDFSIVSQGILVVAGVDALDRTGVEMEALTTCTVAALTIYAAYKSADPTMVVTDATVLEKSGGRSGSWRLTSAGVVVNNPVDGSV